MQTFAAQLSTSRSNGATRNDGAVRSQDDAGASGGFDRMLQSRETRAEAATPSRATAAKPSQKPREPGVRDDARSEAKDDVSPTPRDDRQDCAAEEADSGNDSPADSGTSTANQTAAPSPVLPEQLLAMLNGLNGAAPAAAETPAPLPTDLLGTHSNSTTKTDGKPLLPVLPMQTDAPTTAADGDVTTFALAMAATAADAGVDAAGDGAALPDLEAIGTTPLAQPVSATGPTLTRNAVTAVPAQPPVPLDAGFDDGVGSRIAWMAEQRIGHAEIRVSPEHLGTIDVRLQLDGNKVNAEFHSAQADVRHALESSIPRLREMLGQQGLQLGHAGVGQQSSGQTPSGAGRTQRDDGGEPGTAAIARPATLVRATRGLLDEYA